MVGGYREYLLTDNNVSLTTLLNNWALVFQRRLNGQTDFYRGWEAYKNGFGDLEAEFWLGNQRIHTLTAAGRSELRVDMSDFDGNRAYAKYSTFAVGDAVTNYNITVAGYSGNAGDSLENHNGQAFTTKDRDNDPWTFISYKSNCGIYRQGAWWFNNCGISSLNGLYMGGGKSSEKGILCVCVVPSTTTSYCNDDVQLRLLDNQNDRLVAISDVSKANKPVKQFDNIHNCHMQLKEGETMVFKMWIYVLILFVLTSTATSNSAENVEVRLLDNQNAPLVATLDMTKADERIKQFVSDAIEAKMKKLEVNRNNLKSQMAYFETNLTDQSTDYINEMVGKVAKQRGLRKNIG
ncbi:Hypothetical predicted protein [Mytilus galloprovincialis]|uniref:Fibrinogen C-terminal domain-containing protein n=1 Tax=Mytilus galloprovincialis TaxID=29158 RepID=A0A8B6FKA3_MYTGA|nr:Hypothetical predicted protein [Mytilus galloprovincialis]